MVFVSGSFHLVCFQSSSCCSMCLYFIPFSWLDNILLYICTTLCLPIKRLFKGPVPLGLLGQCATICTLPFSVPPTSTHGPNPPHWAGVIFQTHSTAAQVSNPESHQLWQKQLKFLLREFVMTLKTCCINLHGPDNVRCKSRAGFTGHVTCADSQGPVLGLMRCCHHLGSLNF